MAVNKFLDKFEDRLSVVIPSQAGLFKLLARRSDIGHGHFDRECAVLAVGSCAQEGVLNAVSQAGHDSNFQGAVANTPVGSMFTQPAPPASQFTIEAILEYDVFLRRARCSRGEHCGQDSGGNG